MTPDDIALIRACAERARDAARDLRRADTARRQDALEAIAGRIDDARDAILAANAKDIAAATATGLSAAMVDRLRLDTARLDALSAAVREVAALPDPLGPLGEVRVRADGLRIARRRVPLGAIAMIYESRPNVTVDAAVLCLKSGNAAVLRGGREAAHSNAALLEVVRDGLQAAGLPRDAVQGVPTADRAAIAELLRHDDCLALAIPRGGEGLIRHVAEVSRVPVIRHYKGVCHLYVEASADLDAALRLAIDGKCARPSACNALETLLVDAAVAPTFLPRLGDAMRRRGVRLRADAPSRPLLPGADAADATDWDTEYLDLVLAVKTVDGMDEALDHIARHGSLHTEAIATLDPRAASRFQAEVDASVVAVNASTRFNDGGELGLGAEIGISTTKLHAYGPMGLESLTATRWDLVGDGHVRAPVADGT